MAYIKTTLTEYCTQIEFYEIIKNFFVNNEVAPFELISEDLTNDSPKFIFERNNLKLQLVRNGIYDMSVRVSAKRNNGEYVEQKQVYVKISPGSDPGTHKLPILLALNGDTLVLQMADHTDTSVFFNLTVIDTVLENGTNIIGVGEYSSGNTSITFREPDEQQKYVPRPFHTGSNVENSLILSNQLAFNDSNGVYFSDTSGLISAGGARQFGCYITDSETYYGLLTDVCIPIGEKLEYEIGA